MLLVRRPKCCWSLANYGESDSERQLEALQALYVHTLDLALLGLPSVVCSKHSFASLDKRAKRATFYNLGGSKKIFCL